MIFKLDHIQLALPAGSEALMRGFYCDILGLAEIPKPAPLQERGGFWASLGSLEIHFGVDPHFVPATKAHPAFVTDDLNQLAENLRVAGYPVRWDRSLQGVKRLFTDDPVGNRIELIAD